MSHVALLRPPIVFSASCFSSPVSLPIGLAYVAASLRGAGHEVSVLDALGEGVNRWSAGWNERVLIRGLPVTEIVERLPKAADAIGVSAMFSQEWPYLRDLLAKIRLARPGIPIILGGEHATAAARHILESCPAATFVVRGEGERVVLELMEHLEGRRDGTSIRGLTWRNSSGRVVSNPDAPRLRDPDALPWPAWDLFPLESYFRTGEGHGVDRGRTITMLATRGCPYQCTFCSAPAMWTTTYVMRDPAKVVDELEHWVKTYAIENVDFADLTAVVRKDWILAFCRELTRRGVKAGWQLPSGTRSEALDEEVLDAMRAAGCRDLTYAPESGSEATLERVQKKVRLARMQRSIDAAKRRGFSVKCNFVIGFPHESRRDVWLTLLTALRFSWLGVDDIALYPFTPYPGTALFQELLDSGRIKRLDLSYFESLMAIMDLRLRGLYCKSIGPWELGAYQLGGMLACYALGYARRPSRLIRIALNYLRGRADSGFETRVFALLRRLRALRMSEV